MCVVGESVGKTRQPYDRSVKIRVEEVCICKQKTEKPHRGKVSCLCLFGSVCLVEFFLVWTGNPFSGHSPSVGTNQGEMEWMTIETTQVAPHTVLRLRPTETHYAHVCRGKLACRARVCLGIEIEFRRCQSH